MNVKIHGCRLASRARLGIVSLTVLFSLHLFAQIQPATPPLPEFDKRARLKPTAAENSQRTEAQAKLQTLLPSAKTSFDPMLGSPSFVHAQSGFLTGLSGEGRAVTQVVSGAIPANDLYRGIKTFLNEHRALFGHGADALQTAHLTRESVGAHNGLRTVVWQQQVDGLPVFEAMLIGNITKPGELVSLASKFLPDPDGGASLGTPDRVALLAAAPISARDSLVRAAAHCGEEWLSEELIAQNGTVGDGYVAYKTPHAAYVRQVWLPVDRQKLRLCWEVLLDLHQRRERRQVLIDSQTGEVWLNRNLTRHLSPATYTVFTSDSPSPLSPGSPTPNLTQPPVTNRSTVTIDALSTNASPNGWINDGGNETIGNNADVFLDRNDDDLPDRARPQGSPLRTFNFPLNLSQNPATYSDASVVEIFYWLNWYHDRLYDLGFTEAAGNYQTSNFGRGGLGGDQLRGHAQDGADVGLSDNSSFAQAPDGLSGNVYMFVFPDPSPDRDGAMDTEVLLHEATHGTSERLVGGGVLISALQTAGMGEGWSDFFALSLLSESGDDVDGVYAMGGYATFRFLGVSFPNYYFGIRHYPYSTDLTKNPFTFKDIDPLQVSPHTGVPLSPIFPFNQLEANEVHHAGEIWCMTLWEARANLIKKYGYAGNQIMLQLVTDGMKLGPANPNFLEARDAIFLADQVNHGGANFLELWRAFAKRGMGFSATCPDSSSTVGVVEAFDLPAVRVQSTAVIGGNGNGVIDVNECNQLRVVLKNESGRSASGISLRLSAATPGATVSSAVSPYPSLAINASATNGTVLLLSTGPDFICGTPIVITAVITTDQATTTNLIQLPTGLRAAPLQFENSTPIPIPDANQTGISSSVVVSNYTGALRGVAVSFYLTHTYDADLTLSLVGPNGQTVILSANEGVGGDNFGVSCSPETLRATLDDDALTPLAAGFAPFVGVYKPDQALSAFSTLSGTQVNGTWTLHVVDGYSIDVGTLQCWSLKLFPAICADGGGVCQVTDLAIGMKTTPSAIFAGSNFTYNVTVTNLGLSLASGVIVTQQIPTGINFVSASPSQGIVTYSNHLVVVNLGDLGVGAVATVTVTAVPVASGLYGSTATVSFAGADANLSNNTTSASILANVPTADLALGLTGSPEVALAGSDLTYVVAVTNYGPVTPAFVRVTNTLPTGIAIKSLTLSQGTTTTNGNVLVMDLGSVPPGGIVTATITVVPGTPGIFAVTSALASGAIDPVSNNNTASVTTTVLAAADLALQIHADPRLAVTGSNLSFTMTLTNRGPLPAYHVQIAGGLSGPAEVRSLTTSVGAVALIGGVLTANFDTLANNESAVVSLLVTATNNGLISLTAAVSADEADPNLDNNSATTAVAASPPFIDLVRAGTIMLAESRTPADNALEAGETVTIEFRLRNEGNVANTNLVATLQELGGVTAPSGPQTFGLLTPDGPAVGRPFTFTAMGTNGGKIEATLQLQDGAADLGTVVFEFDLPRPALTFSNPVPISIGDHGPASPYPSTIIVNGFTGLVGKVTVTLADLTHAYPDDLDILLVGPNGQTTVLMSDAGGANGIVSTDLTFDDEASSGLPDDGQITSGTFKPTDYEGGDSFSSPAPAGPYGAALTPYIASSPNGTWSLYVMDDTTGDSGAIAQGWSLNLTPVTPINPVADLSLTGSVTPNPAVFGDVIVYTFAVTNRGPDPATEVSLTNLYPTGMTFVSASTSQGAVTTIPGRVEVAVGQLNPGVGATLTLVVSSSSKGLFTSTTTVHAAEHDLIPANDSLAISATVTPPIADLELGMTAAPNPTFVGSNVNFTLTVTNRGPGVALGVTIADVLPSGGVLGVIGTTRGSVTNVGGSVNGTLGDLGPNESAVVTIGISALAPAIITNRASVLSRSSDPVPANNTAKATAVVKNPVPVMFATPLINHGSVEFTLIGDPGFAYALQSSPDLTSWQTVATNTVGGDGTIRFTNAANLGPVQQFYRAVLINP